MSDNIPPPLSPPSEAAVKEWLDYAFASLLARREEVNKVLAASIAEHPAIVDGDEDTAGVFTENIRIAQVLLKSAKDGHDKEKAPFLRAGRQVDAWTNAFSASVSKVLDPCRNALLDYGNRKALKARQAAEEAARMAQAEADRKAAEAAQAAAVSLFDDNAEDKLDAAAEAQAAAEKARLAALAKPAEASRTAGHYGAVASIRTRWDFAVTDISKVPLDYLTVDEGVVREAMRARDLTTGRPTAVIPGIEWIETRSLGVR